MNFSDSISLSQIPPSLLYAKANCFRGGTQTGTRAIDLEWAFGMALSFSVARPIITLAPYLFRKE